MEITPRMMDAQTRVKLRQAMPAHFLGIQFAIQFAEMEYLLDLKHAMTD